MDKSLETVALNQEDKDGLINPIIINTNLVSSILSSENQRIVHNHGDVNFKVNFYKYSEELIGLFEIVTNYKTIIDIPKDKEGAWLFEKIRYFLNSWTDPFFTGFWGAGELEDKKIYNIIYGDLVLNRKPQKIDDKEVEILEIFLPYIVMTEKLI